MNNTRRPVRPSGGPSRSSRAVTGRLGWLLAVLAVVLALFVVASTRSPQIEEDAAAPDVPDIPPARLKLPTEPLRPSVDQLHQEAEEAISRLLTAYPDSASAIHTVASHYLQVRQFEKAGELWERAIKLAPSLAGARAGLAEVEMELGDNARAVAILDEALSAGLRTPEIYHSLCQALQNAGEFDRAEAICREGLSEYPDDVDLWVELGRLQLQLQKLEESKASFERALTYEPESIPATYSLASVLARLGEAEKAQEYEQRHTQLKEQHPLSNERFQVIFRGTLQKIVVTTLVRAAIEHQRQGDIKAAEENLLRALALHPRESSVYRNLIAIYRRQGRVWDAHLLQQRLLDIQPSVENLINFASLSAQLDRHEEAEAALHAALQLEPDSALAHRGLAILYQFRGEFQLARRHAEHLVRSETDPENYLLLSRILQQLGETRGAREATETARNLSDQQPSSASMPLPGTDH